MMVRIKNLSVLLCVTLLSLSGCSDLTKGKVVNAPIESNRFNAGCELIIEDFQYILQRDISPQISCLQKNIDLFMRVVESDKPGYLSRTAFEQYIVKNLPDFKPENVRAIKSVFEIAHLLFGDNREYLSPSSVKKIFDFVFIFNRELPKIYESFISEEEVNLALHNNNRARVYNVADKIARELLIIHRHDRGDQIHKVNILDILESFTNSSTADVLQTVKAVLFIKKVVLGGNKNELTHKEIRPLLYKLANIGGVAFDLARVKYIKLDQPTLLDFIGSILKSIDDPEKPDQSLLHYSPDSGERLFSIDELIEAIPQFIDEDDFPNLKKYRTEVLQLKMTVMSEAIWNKDEDLKGKEYILPNELMTLLNHARSLTERGAKYHHIYEFFKTYLNSPGMVNINYNNYLLVFPMHSKYVKEFARIVNSYRFFSGDFQMPFYSTAYQRNAVAVVDQGLIEYLLTIASRRYGKKDTTAVGGYGMDLDNILNLVDIFKKPLVEENIITEGREKNLTENITLLMTLFQSMSNGDGLINIDEGSAFLTQVFTSMKHAEMFQEEMSARCQTDERRRITDLNCHRENYFDILCEKFPKEFPLLFKSLGIKSCADRGDMVFIKDYLKTIETVARTCTVFKTDGKDVPLTDDDYMPLLVMIQTIEGAVLRFDVNKNNKLDPTEVTTAYDTTFRTAIEALVEKEQEIIAKLPFNLGSAISKKIYYYLIKHKSIPDSLGEYLKLLTIGPTTAQRDTFAAVLKIIAENSTPSTFDCEKLR